MATLMRQSHPVASTPTSIEFGFPALSVRLSYARPLPECVEKSSALHHTRASVALCRTCHLGGSIGPTKRVAHYLFCGRSVSRVLRLNRCTPWGCRLRMVMRASGGGNFGWIHALHAVLACPRGAPCLGPTARRKGPDGPRVARAEPARPSSRPLSGPLSRPLLFAHCPLSGPLSRPLFFSNAPLSAH